jgi:hypothetical protein
MTKPNETPGAGEVRPADPDDDPTQYEGDPTVFDRRRTTTVLSGAAFLLALIAVWFFWARSLAG